MRSFQTRIVLFFSVLLICVQGAILVSVYWISRTNVIDQLGQNLLYAERFFDRLLTERSARIAGETRILVADFGFRATVSQGDPNTIASALENLSLRIRGQRAFYVDLDRTVLADTAGRYRNQPFMFPAALELAEAEGRAVVFGLLEDRLYEWAIVPVLAPMPVGWVAVALAVDQGLVHQFRQASTLPLDISLAVAGPAACRILASSLTAGAQALLCGALLREFPPRGERPLVLELGADTFITRFEILPGAEAGGALLAVLQIDLAEALRPYRVLLFAVLGLLVLGLVATLLGAVWIAHRLARPVRELASASRRLLDGEPAEPLPVTRQDELGGLTETFNRAAQMAAQLSELEQKDLRRRELVATVSHDLRTPLTSLHGFLETLQIKAETLPITEQRRFLSVALRQTEKVSRLAQELFELARLECGGSGVQWEDFCLSELIQDVTQKFQLGARRRGVALGTRLTREAPPVRADIGLIERVLTNLIDNALKATSAGGEVCVAACLADDRVEVAVSDTGVGIAPEFLPRLFDWDSPLVRRSGPDAGGLGLIVVARILELHGSTIAVDSAPGQGSVFRFALALAPGQAGRCGPTAADTLAG
jgi:signal transduction histidine kinase